MAGSEGLVQKGPDPATTFKLLPDAADTPL